MSRRLAGRGHLAGWMGLGTGRDMWCGKGREVAGKGKKKINKGIEKIKSRDTWVWMYECFCFLQLERVGGYV